MTMTMTFPVTGPVSSRGVSDWPSHFGAMGQSYEDRAFAVPALAEQGQHELDIVLNSLGEGHGRKLLDIGAGTGRFTLALIRAGWNVTSFDGSTEMLECIGSRTSSARLVIGRLGEPLPFLNGEFDAVVAMRVLKYVSDTAAAVGEIGRVVKRGGAVTFDVANRDSLARFGYADSPMGFVTPKSLRAVANAAGLGIIATHDGFRLPHAIVRRASSLKAANAVRLAERGLAEIAGRNSGRGARSIIVETKRA
jgi:SAM-dependent methyltransferase